MEEIVGREKCGKTNRETSAGVPIFLLISGYIIAFDRLLLILLVHPFTPMRHPFLFLSLALLLFSCGRPKADLVLVNGRIYTLEPGADSLVTAVACQEGRIVATGSREEIDEWIGSDTEVFDLKGRTMIPGLIEGHAHLFGLGRSKRELDLSGATSYRDVVAAVKQAVEKAPPGTWILGRGWHQSKWTSLYGDTIKGFPTHDSLSAVSPNHPVFLSHASGHAALANRKAMQLAGMEGNVFPDEAIIGDKGEVIRNRWGEPVGIFNEHATYIISRHIPATGPADLKADMEAAFQACLEQGITAFHDAGEGTETMEVLMQAHREGKIPLRMYVMLAGSDSAYTSSWFRKGPLIDPYLTVRSVKLYGDGALGSRGAWLLQPYQDQPGHVGHPVTPIPYLRSMTQAAFDAGFQVCIHAIGDMANRTVLDLYLEVFLTDPGKAASARFRVEHAQHIDPADIPRFGAMGVIPSVQGIHHASDRPWAIQRLGQARISAGAYPWQSLIQSGARVVNGTDAPVEPVNPFACLYASITRKTLTGTPEGGYEPAQRMTRMQALKSYTTTAAYAAFQENDKGTIATGKWADFTVLSDNFFEIPEEELLNLRAEATVVGGVVRWKSNNW